MAIPPVRCRHGTRRTVTRTARTPPRAEARDASTASRRNTKKKKHLVLFVNFVELRVFVVAFGHAAGGAHAIDRHRPSHFVRDAGQLSTSVIGVTLKSRPRPVKHLLFAHRPAPWIGRRRSRHLTSR